MPIALKKTRETLPARETLSNRAGETFRVSSTAIFALVILLVLNVGFWVCAGEDKRSSDLWSGTGSIDLAVNAFTAVPERPTVVLLGSSLMMFPFWSMDRQGNSNIGDILHYHQSVALEKVLEEKGFTKPFIFNFAIFGQMVSDAFIYVNEYLKGNKAPEYLVYGIAPRDFSDSDLPSPMATNTFKRLVGLNNFGTYAPFYLPKIQDKVDFLLKHLDYFYARRWRLQIEIERALEKFYKIIGWQTKETSLTQNNTSVGFMLSGTWKQRWEGSEQEYARRYKNIDKQDLDVQMGFLRQLIACCKQRGIKVIVLNMPLTTVNRKLLPPGFYTRFRGQLRELTNKPGVRFVDIGDSSEFTFQDFWDTAHLETSGGKRLLKYIVSAMEDLKLNHNNL